MRFSTSIVPLVLVTSAFSSPISVDSIVTDRTTDSFEEAVYENGLDARQSASLTANEFTNGGCKSVVLIFARGTAQLGNLGATPGLQLYNQIKSALGASTIAVQGVNYDAETAHGTLPEGVDATAAANMATLIRTVANTCPSAKILLSGYSQGAAMVHASVKRLSTTVQARINAAVTFGDTRNEQDGGQIPGISADRTLIICNDGDLVCDGTLQITSAHLAYGSRVPEAVSFLTSKVN
ncbi:cutinase [Truncatella angustata]|uniref:cutinase n=1 Tax=Truncatella angustata TaxID=152316 RepID=A0A9P8RKQ5_9PEZI|nr:cutinase [Truncatella angustata]KAH6647845.1 cutinase [Truncatella angustata]